MSLPRYPEYKDSGVEWLGEVPAHWDVTRLRQLGTVLKGSGASKEDVVETGIPCVRYGDLYTTHSFSIRRARTYVTAERAAEYTLILYGDVLFAASGETLEDIGKSAVNLMAESACCGGDIIILRPSAGCDPTFLGYACDAQPSTVQKAAMGRGTIIKHISAGDIKNLGLAVPPFAEQAHIAQFLDLETAKIDALVAEHQRLIELLKEKRQAVISHSVTKGLNPNVPMKDSGIEWLGEIPVHWPVARLCYYASVENGTTPSRDNAAYWRDGKIPWLASGEVNQYRISEPSEYITELALANCSLRLLPRGTVVVGMIGQGKTRGQSAVLEIEACVNQNLAAIVPGNRLESDYLLYVFKAMYNYLREFGRGGNQAALNSEILSALRVPLPSILEQREICGALRRWLTDFDALTAEATRAINLLEERRTALISAAVTGQIDIRSAQRPNS